MAWGSIEHLLAAVIDALFAVNGISERFPRPGEKAAESARREVRGEKFVKRAAERAQKRREATRG